MPAAFERFLVFLGVCVPVPLLAATGLSIPLPGTVERLAAKLVPFAEAAALAESGAPARAPRGVVVRTPTGKRTDLRSDLVEPRSAVTGPTSVEPHTPLPTAGRPDTTSPKPAPAKKSPTAPAAPGGNPGGTETPQPQPAQQPAPQPQPEPRPEPKPQPPPPLPPLPQPQPQPQPGPQPLPLPLPPPPPLPIPLPPPPPLPIPLPPPPPLPGLGK